MSRRIGFIGAGRMAEALISGILKAELAKKEDIIAADVDGPRREVVARQLGIRTTPNNKEVFQQAETIFLAIKPQHAEAVLREVRDVIGSDHLLVSIMAGVSIATLQSWLPVKTRIVRAMPNTPCLVQEAASAVAKGLYATEDDANWIVSIFRAVGVAESVDENLLDAVTGLSGSGPAYVYMVIEALADGGVAEGLPRDIALRLAAQTVAGAATMVLHQQEHPAVLRDQVTSPAGTTAEGLGVLEKSAVRSAFAEAVRAASRRSKSLGEGTS